MSSADAMAFTVGICGLGGFVLYAIILWYINRA